MVTHLTNRLVWHDNGWNGCICEDPLSNTSCMVHDYIRESGDDEKETRYAGINIKCNSLRLTIKLLNKLLSTHYDA